MKVYPSYILSVLVSLAIHAALIAGLFSIRESDDVRRIVEPQYISANLVKSVSVREPAKAPKKNTDEARGVRDNDSCKQNVVRQRHWLRKRLMRIAARGVR